MSLQGQHYRTHNWGVKWLEEEDIRLLQGIERFGDNDWRRVSEVVGTRDAVKCQQRWDKVLRPDLLKGKWTEEEDQRLRAVVVEGYDHWGKVAEKMPGRTAKQCRERWSNYLDPGLLKTPFTQAEDEKLMLLQRMNGNKWALISREMPGRTENSVKLRFNSLKKVYGDSLSSVSMPAPVHIRPHGYMNYDNNYIDNRRKAESLDSPLQNGNSAKKQRNHPPSSVPNTLMLPPPANYSFVDHSNIFSLNPLNNNMAVMNNLSQHPATTGTVHFFNPSTDTTLLQGSYELTNTSQQVTSEPHGLFYSPSAYPPRDTAHVLLDPLPLPALPTGSADDHDSGNKFASVHNFSESDSSDDEKAQE